MSRAAVDDVRTKPSSSDARRRRCGTSRRAARRRWPPGCPSSPDITLGARTTSSPWRAVAAVDPVVSTMRLVAAPISRPADARRSPTSTWSSARSTRHRVRCFAGAVDLHEAPCRTCRGRRSGRTGRSARRRRRSPRGGLAGASDPLAASTRASIIVGTMKLWVRSELVDRARSSAGSHAASGTLRLPRTKWASIFDPLPWAIEATWTIASPGPRVDLVGEHVEGAGEPGAERRGGALRPPRRPRRVEDQARLVVSNRSLVEPWQRLDQNLGVALTEATVAESDQLRRVGETRDRSPTACSSVPSNTRTAAPQSLMTCARSSCRSRVLTGTLTLPANTMPMSSSSNSERLGTRRATDRLGGALAPRARRQVGRQPRSPRKTSPNDARP